VNANAAIVQWGAEEIHFNDVHPEGPSGEIFPSISELIHSSSKLNQGKPYGKNKNRSVNTLELRRPICSAPMFHPNPRPTADNG
jgi:hypothetical protein